ncbi:hypothetical protein N2152v2_004861 [Parachlorella kessleri]
MLQHGEGGLKGTEAAAAARDHTVCVDVTGLKPSRHYYYRFSSGKLASPVGRTKTTADGPLEEMLFALVSCSNWGWGYFHVYDLVSKVDNLDLVVHCGDYIYEYEKYNYPGRQFQARHGLRPKNQCHTLLDYRARYACYRTDPALQELHRRLPMVAIWDDHEVADEAYTKGATETEESPQQFSKRKLAGVQAFLEWVPIRGMPPEEAGSPQKAQRSFSFGDLATLMLVENRLSRRDHHINMPDTDFYKETAQKDVKKWDDEAIKRAKTKLLAEMKDPDREIIGQQQIDKVAAAVKDSVEGGQPWQILVSGTVMSQIMAPRLVETVALQPRYLRWVAGKALKKAMDPKVAGQEAAELARMYVGMGKHAVQMNIDAWDGYQAEREKVYAALAVPGSNPVVLAGDSHNAWAHELRNQKGQRVGVEFDGPAITSKGAWEDIYCRFQSKVGRLASLFPLYLFTPWIEDALEAANPDTLKYCNVRERGFVLCHLTHTKFHAEFHYVTDVWKKEYKHRCQAAFTVEAGVRGVMQRVPRYLSINGEIPRLHEHGRRRGLVKGTHRIYQHT